MGLSQEHKKKISDALRGRPSPLRDIRRPWSPRTWKNRLEKLGLPYSENTLENRRVLRLYEAGLNPLDKTISLEEADKIAKRERGRKHKRKLLRYKEEVAGRPRPEVCEICSRVQQVGLAWDHCHKGGHFRGWICDRCNRTLGLVEDSIEVLKLLIQYLEKDQNLPENEKIAKIPSKEFANRLYRHMRFNENNV